MKPKKQKPIKHEWCPGYLNPCGNRIPREGNYMYCLDCSSQAQAQYDQENRGGYVADAVVREW